MKTLRKFYSENPGYLKKGVAYVATATKLKDKTVERFRSTEEYKEMKKAYTSASTGRRKSKSTNQSN